MVQQPKFLWHIQTFFLPTVTSCCTTQQTTSLGCLFLQESSGFLCFPFLWHFFYRNHDSCSAVTFFFRKNSQITHSFSGSLLPCGHTFFPFSLHTPIIFLYLEVPTLNITFTFSRWFNTFASPPFWGYKFTTPRHTSPWSGANQINKSVLYCFDGFILHHL